MSTASRWSTTKIAIAAVRDLAHRFVIGIVLLGVIPTAVLLGPRDLVEVATSVRPLVDAGIVLAWSVLLPAQIQGALALARGNGRVLSARAILAIPATFVPVVCAAALFSLSRWVAQFPGLPTAGRAIAGLLMTALIIVGTCRTFTWAFLIVDRGMAPWSALKLGVAQTQNRALRIATLMFVTGAPLLIVSVLMPRPLTWVAWILTMPVATIACARAYDFLSGGPPTQVSSVYSSSEPRRDAPSGV
jgi:hypothetical protein